jgi:lactate dehydrogenase-like 2-hydroxyacid dehydrogenase
MGMFTRRPLSETLVRERSAVGELAPHSASLTPRPADNPLFGLDNVVITPHAAYYSEEAIGTVRNFAAEEVVRVLTGQPPLSPVNAGELVEARWSRAQ